MSPFRVALVVTMVYLLIVAISLAGDPPWRAEPDLFSGFYPMLLSLPTSAIITRNTNLSLGDRGLTAILIGVAVNAILLLIVSWIVSWTIQRLPEGNPAGGDAPRWASWALLAATVAMATAVGLVIYGRVIGI